MTWALVIYQVTVLIALVSIPRASWQHATTLLGPVGAAICALIIAGFWPITLTAYALKGRRGR